MNENNAGHSNPENPPVGVYNQPPPYHENRISPPPFQQHPPAPHVTYPQHASYPYTHANSYPAVNQWSPEHIRQESIKQNNLITSLVGSLGLIFAFSILGVLGAYVSAVACAILMARSLKLGGGYRKGLTCLIISLAVAQICAFLFLMVLDATDMSVYEFLEAYMESETAPPEKTSPV